MKNNFYVKILNWVLPIFVILIILTGEWIEGLVILAAYIVYRFFSERDKFFSFIGKRKYFKGKLRKAVEYYAKAYKTNRAESKVRISYAYTLILTKQYQPAREVLAESKNAADAETVVMQRAICEAVLKWKEDENLRGAIQTISHMDESLRTSSYYGVMGKMMIAAGDEDKSREFNEEAYKYNGKNPAILENLIRIYCNADEFERALKVAKILLKKKPYTPDAYYYCGLSYEKSGDHRKSTGLYKKALSKEESILSSIKHKDITI